jgi:hypothetical protein
MGVPSTIAYAVQGLGALAAITLVAVVWRCQRSLPVRAASLAAATLIAVPVALVYDFLLAGIAIAWMTRAARERGFLQWEKATLAAVFIVPLLSRNFGTATHVPLAPLALIALLALIARRALVENNRENDKARREPGLIPSVTV